MKRPVVLYSNGQGLMLEPWMRPLWERTAETEDGKATLKLARQLSKAPQYAHLSDGELIRLAYWGASGTPDLEGRAALIERVS